MRNLRRRKGRTALTALMLGGGTALIVFSVGLGYGQYAQMTDLATRTYSGHVQVVAHGYHERPSLFRTVPDAPLAVSRMKALPGIAAVSRRVETAGLLAVGNRTTGAQIIAVEPAAEAAVSTVPGWVKDGSWLPDGPLDDDAALPIIVGKGLARRLEVDLGGEVSFVGQAADGSIAAELFTVRGIVNSGADEMDANLAFVRLTDAQELLNLGDRVHRVVGVFHKPGDIDVPEAPPGAVAMRWETLMPELASWIESDRAGLQIFLLVMMVMVLLGVANTLMMSVFERTREYGVMLALGAGTGHILAMTVFEAVWLCLLGVGGGVIVGDLFTHFVPITMPEPMEFGGIVVQEMRGVISLESTVLYPLGVFATGVLASLPPALRAAGLEPVSALRRGA